MRVVPRSGGDEPEMGAAVLASPHCGGVEEPAPDRLSATRRRHHQVLEPAATPVADRLEVHVHGGKADDLAVVDRDQHVGVERLYGMAIGVHGALAPVAGRAGAGRREELLYEIQHRCFVVQRRRPDRQHRETSRNASSVTSRTRAMSASVCAVERNQLWCGWRYTPCAMQAAAKARLRSNEPSSATNVMNGIAGGPV